MDTIANWISSNPYWTVAGLFASFLGMILAIIVPIVQRKRKQLCYTISTTQLVEEKTSSIEGVTILYKDNPVDVLSVANIRIWNGGNTIITSEDFYTKHPLKVIPLQDFVILGVDIPKESSDTIESHITIVNDQIYISFQSFEKKDYISFNVFYTGNSKAQLSIDGKIKEGKIINKTISTEVEINLLSKFAQLTLITMLPFGNYIILTKELISNLFKPPKSK